jgi:hypothetical protein
MTAIIFTTWLLLIQGTYADTPLIVHTYHKAQACDDAATFLDHHMRIHTPVCLKVEDDD